MLGLLACFTLESPQKHTVSCPSPRQPHSAGQPREGECRSCNVWLTPLWVHGPDTFSLCPHPLCIVPPCHRLLERKGKVDSSIEVYTKVAYTQEPQLSAGASWGGVCVLPCPLSPREGPGCCSGYAGSRPEETDPQGHAGGWIFLAPNPSSIRNAAGILASINI